MISITGAAIASLVGSLLAGALMVALQLPSAAIPLVLVAVLAPTILVLRRIDRWHQPPLAPLERALVALAAAIGLVRLAVYGSQYASGVLVAPLVFDDLWHFQELASLVNAERFPPLLNFRPESHFHFYWIAWMPAAALSSLAQTLTGVPLIKLGYGIGALALDLTAAWAVLMLIRHVVPADARVWALAALMAAGAVVGGVLAFVGLLQHGEPHPTQWWQINILVRNFFPTLTTLLVWAPHHAAAMAAVLLAVVVATEPGTLAPRPDRAAAVLAGLLLATAAFSSIFVFAGGVIALSPLAAELLRAGHRRSLAALALAFLLPAIPLSHIYLGADARGGFVLFETYAIWSSRVGLPAIAALGIVVAFAAMMLDVGWLYVVGRLLDPGDAWMARLRRIALASALMLASTAVVSFSGANNYALRGTLVPIAMLACYAACGVCRAVSGGLPGLIAPERARRCAAFALSLAALTHANDVALLTRATIEAPRYSLENASCKRVITTFNDAPEGTMVPPDLAGCRSEFSAYHIERRFTKSELRMEDRELMGRGWSFLGSGPRH